MYSTPHNQPPVTQPIQSDSPPVTDAAVLQPPIEGMVPGYESDYVVDSSPQAPPYSPLTPITQYVTCS